MSMPAESKEIRAAQYVRMSTDHQRYSIENQIDFIADYARMRGYQVVRTYADPGRSGLTLKARPGLRRLLDDVVGGRTDFSAVLVYDVSRWGRFQEPDEAAAYEHLCRQHGVAITYCAEPFDNTGGAFNSLVKSLKRTMAAEFSRELSRRVVRGQAKVASQGYWVGSVAPYGYERWAVQPGTGRRYKLERGETKAQVGFRTVLEPGPVEEVRMVQRAFRLFTEHRRNLRQIAQILTAEGWRTRHGAPWNLITVRHILRSERYIGVISYAASATNLTAGTPEGGDLVRVRVEGAIPALVDTKTFAAAQAIFADRRPTGKGWSDEQMLDRLEAKVAGSATVSCRLIDQDRTMPSCDMYRQRFGSVSRALMLVGRPTLQPQKTAECRHAGRARRTHILGELRMHLEAAGLPTEILTRNTFKAGEQQIGLYVRGPASRGRGQGDAWEVRLPKASLPDVLVGVRLGEDRSTVIDFYAIPRAAVRAHHLMLGPAARACRKGHRCADVEAVSASVQELLTLVQLRTGDRQLVRGATREFS